MAPLRRSNPHFIFSYSVPQSSSGTSYVQFWLQSAPYRVRSARPTITRVFKQAPRANARSHNEEFRREAAASSSHQDRTPSPTPPPSPILPSTPTCHLGVSSHSKTPDGDAQVEQPSTPHKGKSSERTPHPGAPITRSASRSSVKGDAPVGASKSSSRSKKQPGPPSSGISVWTRFGIKNGAPIFMRRERTSSSTDRECVTAYYESFSVEELRIPPDLSEDSQLTEGDIFINTIFDSGIAQMWIWTRDGGRVAFWKVAREGDIREDGRRLSITPTLGLPSWVKPEWCMRQLLKQQKVN